MKKRKTKRRRSKRLKVNAKVQFKRNIYTLIT